ncbi:MAG TPA: amylo-alpha-1,6-glucosidase [Gammaproteobacteria bacterium]|nr:amylo-alpha-1,6-glucosidase [Gammaproteobacteria bacterium]
MSHEEVIHIGEHAYVPATSSRLDDRTLVLKHGNSFAVFDRFGDIHALGHGEQGIYHQDTRFLSRLDLRLADGRRPVLLNSTLKQDNSLLTVDLTIPEIHEDGRCMVPIDTVHVFRAKLLYQDICYEHLRLCNYGEKAVSIPFTLSFDADYADIFEVRGKQRKTRGQLFPVGVQDQTITLAYTGLDKITRKTYIQLENTNAVIRDATATFEVALAPGEDKDIYVSIQCVVGEAQQAHGNYLDALQALSDELEIARSRYCAIHTSNEQFNDWLNRSQVDLNLLISNTPHGPYPYAGVPWFSTPFGRDGLITALHALWVNPEIARGVLAYLAANQATDLDPEHEAEPGKILHETRGGEMSTLGEVPFAQYYGTIDATPLFVVLAGAYYQHTGDRIFIETIWPNIEAALAWIDDYGDKDGDGFIEYASQNAKGLSQQGWKDSDDSVFHADGSPAHGAIALCEVQGYVYDAWRQAEKLYLALGKETQAWNMKEKAEAMKKRFDKAFWCEEIGSYALALDGEKQPCRVQSSNAGHTLFSGIASHQHARRVVQTLMDKHNYSGWGIRTIATQETRYNPMSYHNGAVWPHDNAMIALGFARYGYHKEATQLLTGLFDASLFLHLRRMPELFCGFLQRKGEGPTLYPLACAPQAWASTVPFAMMQACLGLEISNTPRAQVTFKNPHLPPWLHTLNIDNLRIGDASIHVVIQRYDTDVGVNVLRREGDVQVTVVK